MDLEGILLEYGKAMNLGKLHLDLSGICTLLINDDYLVSFEKSLHHDGFYVYASIGVIIPGKEEEVGLMALEGNLFGKETGQAGIGYVSQTRTLVLFEYFDNHDTTFADFSQKFNKFLQYLFYWKMKLESADLSDQPIPKKTDSHRAYGHKNVFYA